MGKRRNRRYISKIRDMRHMPRIKKERITLTLLFAGLVFFVLFSVVLISAVVLVVFLHLGLISPEDFSLHSPAKLVWLMALVCIITGMVFAYLFSRILAKPANEIINCLNCLACGDYEARIHFKGILASHDVIREFTESFNAMAAELQSTEMLRSDFVNNFSHEFKTPIVSIAGFAKLLRRGNVSPQEQDEYLGIIEDESMRLASMATNTLNLTRVENQSILTDVTHYNVSEQIRSCVLLLEHKWADKNLDLDLEFEEYEIDANRELMKQVWLNLLDNAIKFTPVGGCIRVSIEETEKTEDVDGAGRRLSVSVLNTGSEIPPDAMGRIFQKFYKADTSHSGEGNGIGLALVRRVVDLHGGEVTAESHDGFTRFTVSLGKQE